MSSFACRHFSVRGARVASRESKRRGPATRGTVRPAAGCRGGPGNRSTQRDTSLALRPFARRASQVAGRERRGPATRDPRPATRGTVRPAAGYRGGPGNRGTQRDTSLALRPFARRESQVAGRKRRGPATRDPRPATRGTVRPAAIATAASLPFQTPRFKGDLGHPFGMTARAVAFQTPRFSGGFRPDVLQHPCSKKVNRCLQKSTPFFPQNSVGIVFVHRSRVTQHIVTADDILDVDRFELNSAAEQA